MIKLKRQILIAMGAAMMLSCSTDDLEQSVSGTATPVPIRLTTNVDEATLIGTRADASYYTESTAFRDGDVIGLYAYNATGLLAAGTEGSFDNQTGSSTASGGFIEIDNDAAVTYTASTNYNYADKDIAINSNTLTYGTDRYWPTDQNCTFFSYYPQGNSDISLSSEVLDGTNVPSTINFTMQTAAENQVDFLVSEVKTLKLSDTGKYGASGNDYDGVVPLEFHHALAQVRFYVFLDVEKNSVWYDEEAGEPIAMTLNISLGGLYETGTLTVGANASSNDWGGHTWGSQSGSVDVTASSISFTEEESEVVNASGYTFDPDAYSLTDAEKMLVIPGSYSGENIPKLTLTINDKEEVKDKSLPANYDSDSDGTKDQVKWDAGYIYNYYFIVNVGLHPTDGYFVVSSYEAEQWSKKR